MLMRQTKAWPGAGGRGTGPGGRAARVSRVPRDAPAPHSCKHKAAPARAPRGPGRGPGAGSAGSRGRRWPGPRPGGGLQRKGVGGRDAQDSPTASPSGTVRPRKSLQSLLGFEPSRVTATPARAPTAAAHTRGGLQVRRSEQELRRGLPGPEAYRPRVSPEHRPGPAGRRRPGSRRGTLGSLLWIPLLAGSGEAPRWGPVSALGPLGRPARPTRSRSAPSRPQGASGGAALALQGGERRGALSPPRGAPGRRASA